MPLQFKGRLPTTGQLPSLQSYTQFLLFFPDTSHGLEQAEYQNHVISTLKAASRKLVTRFPWLGGQIVNTGHRYGGKEEGDSGVFEVLPFLSAGTDGGRMVRVTGKERFDISFKEALEGRGKTELVKSEDFTAKKLMPDVYDLSGEGQAVLGLEVTFLEGGCVVCVSGLHLGVDMTGVGGVIGELGRACREESGKEEDGGGRDGQEGKEMIEEGKSMIKEGIEMIKEGKEMIREEKNEAASIPDWKTLLTKHPDPKNHQTQPTKTIWKYVCFSKEKLAGLKILASSPSSSDVTNSWISTDDALASFLWHRILLARLPRFSPTLGVFTTLCRALNARRYLSPPLPATSLEHCVACTYTPLELSLFDSSQSIGNTLPLLAKKLRSSIASQATPQSLESLFTFIAEIKDKDTISFGAKLDLSGTDILVSSGASLGIYDVDFSPLLGKPALVRRPWVECTDGASEGILYFMPKDREGCVDVLMCLGEEDWEILERDEVWREWCEMIG